MAAWLKWSDPRDGDRRIVSRFLFLPRTISGETRWLGIQKIQQHCEYVPEYVYGCRFEILRWVDNAWR